MKINRKDPSHLAVLATAVVFSFIGALARLVFKRNRKDKIIVFYGHTLNGNLKAFYDFLIKQDGYSPYFLALNKDYIKRLKARSKHPSTILSIMSIKDMLLATRADAFITSHGLHLMNFLKKITNIKFIDVWHAVSYKGFDAHNFRRHHSNNEIWVTSKFIRQMYTNKFKFQAKKVKITGYARTDQLVNGSLDKQEIIKKYSIPKADKYILIAPTWKQDDEGRSVLPFGMDEKEFFKGLDKLAGSHRAHIIFRTHLNSDDEVDVSKLDNTSFMPYSKYEVVEDFLFIADTLITDWSSTGIDFLPLKRPAIFLDVPAPFKKGFELGPEHRYGDIVGSFEELKQALDKNLKNPKVFNKLHKKQIEQTTKIAYGDTLDGKSSERYFSRLKKLLAK